MPNQFTGDFDVVAEFSLPAVDRVLAAMHQTGRIPHSVSVSVNDNPLPGTHPGLPVVGSVVDALGDAVVDQSNIGKPNISPSAAVTAGAILSRFDPIVNPVSAGFALPPIVPSHLQGRAQFQLFPPTLDVPDATGLNLALTLNMMSRYFPDPQTAPLAEFIRGDLHITAPVSQIHSKAANVIEIDFKASQAIINFAPTFSSASLSTDDLAGINLLIRNALVTSFLPSSATLPSGIAQVEFKTLLGPPKAIAVMLNTTEHAAGSGSVNNVFLAGADDFAYAASRDFVLSALQPVVNNLLSQPFPPAKFSVNLGLTTLHFTYPITLTSASFDLQPGKIVMTVTGHAGQSNHSWAGPFDFSVTMDFSLVPDLFTVSLVSGSISVNTNSLLAELVDFFSGAVTSAIAAARDAALSASGTTGTIQNMFDTRFTLGNFLNSLLVPATAGAPPSNQNIQLLYGAVSIQPAGIVLRGFLNVNAWPAPHVEYQPISSNNTTGGLLGNITNPLGRGTDYSAFLSWIPGGTISQYEWSIRGIEQNHPFSVDPNKFVLLHSGPAATAAIAPGSGSGSGSGSAPGAAAGVILPSDPLASVSTVELNPPGYSSICLTVRGTRIAAAASSALQPVSGSICGYTRVPVIPNGLATSATAFAPVLPVTQPGPSGEVQVTGHTLALVARNVTESPNVLLHIADSKSATRLDLLTKALAQSKRTDAPTAVLAVVPPNQLATLRYTQRVIYVEDPDGSWEKILGAAPGKRPWTSILDRRGKTVWTQEGPVDADVLAAALAKNLVGGGSVPLSIPLANTRIGQLAPDFYFEYARGHQLTLRKLRGRPLFLRFWKSTSQPSINAVLDAQKNAAASADTSPLVLAINDGEPSDQARAAAAENGFTATLVTDPNREICVAYGITLAPTILDLDASGLITAIRYGFAPGAGTPAPSKGSSL